ncbi:MAG: DUF1036 domain-containing protein [Veillonellaceae bacterium]|jgi:hypothetical protein|nr:DUF1036 domain-containing protein [Veillonellaceae bacterium]
MTFKNRLIKGLIGLWIVLAVAVIPQPAEAVNIQMTNPYSDTMWAAIVFFEDAADEWVTKGWYKIAP